MYIVKVEVKRSSIEGQGVFALEDIAKGQTVWKFGSNHDKFLSVKKFSRLPGSEKIEIEKVGYLSPTTDRWVYPPPGDAARFTNHSQENNLAVVYDPKVSEEPYFIANQDIKLGDELTNNYLEFDKRAKSSPSAWL